MPRFCANLSFLFTEWSFAERFAHAAAAGFAGVECMFPESLSASEMAALQRAAGVGQVLLNFPAGNWAQGERGLACLPGREADFRSSVEQAMQYAEALDCKLLHCMAGLTPKGEAEAVSRSRYVANLRYAADQMVGLGATVTLEPINTRIDMPGYWLDSVEKALGLLDEIDRPNVKLQLDLYHAHVMGEDCAALLREHLPRIAHIQLADYPGRHEPGTGEIDFPALFACLGEMDYSGWMGCEYLPLGRTNDGLGWMLGWPE